MTQMPVHILYFAKRPLTGLVCITLMVFGCKEANEKQVHFPQVHDSRLHISLIDTTVMTPIGLAIDSHDALYVLESNTHSPPSDYTGPPFDQIKKGVDTNEDGEPETWIIFADSIEDGMNLAFDPDDGLFLTTKNEVVYYQDHDRDGKSDERTQLLHMVKPDYVYDHAGILGVTYSDGWLYVSRGNTGSSAWRIQGADSTYLEGYGDGGNLMRCRPDGTSLEEIATGFWNPFSISFSQEGRLLLTDNDPDSRGPNRLIEIVPGGNYGYQSIYGGSGIHPFLAWNGELPGTLPFAAALGEAPCALIDASFTNFPADYANTILVNIWEENTIVRIPLRAHQSTVRGEAEIVVQGDSLFHPVALATNSKGELYVTDWVIRQYPNHGHGRIWRLSLDTSGLMVTPSGALQVSHRPAAGFFGMMNDKSSDQLIEDLRSGDPFLQTIARKKLSSPAFYPDLLAMAQSADSELRLQALLTLLSASLDLNDRILVDLLHDDREDIRRMALIYIATQGRTALYEQVNQSLYDGYITADLFETYLATIRHLQPAFKEGYSTQTPEKASDLERELPDKFVFSLIINNTISEEIRAAALPYLESPASYVLELLPMLKTSFGSEFKKSLLNTLKQVGDEDVAKAMVETALNRQLESSVRAQALVLLSYQSTTFCEEVTAILRETDEVLQEIATGYLCKCGNDKNSEAVAKLVENIGRKEVTDRWKLCNSGRPEEETKTDETWTLAVDDTGLAEKGKWVFQSVKAQCQSCHKVGGFGGSFGPDLSHVGSSKSKEQLVSAILEPSQEISPEWQGWFVKTRQGQTHYGRQIDVQSHGVELMAPTGEFVTYSEPADYGVAPSSLMPEGLENTLTESEFNHLIAYLASLK